MNREVVDWLESPAGETWSKTTHHVHLWRLVDVKSDDPDEVIPAGDVAVFLWHTLNVS